MTASDFRLTTPPSDSRERELWLQHAVGFMLCKDVREYALSQMDPTLSDEAKAAAIKGINDTMYGMMMVLDGVTGTFGNASMRVNLRATAEVLDNESDEVMESLDLQDGDGMCMGYHGWIVQDFGDPPPFIQE